MQRLTEAGLTCNLRTSGTQSSAVCTPDESGRHFVALSLVEAESVRAVYTLPKVRHSCAKMYSTWQDVCALRSLRTHRRHAVCLRSLVPWVAAQTVAATRDDHYRIVGVIA